MNPEETLANYLIGNLSRPLRFNLRGTPIQASVFAVRADYVELEAQIDGNMTPARIIRVPFGAITWVTQ